MSVLYNPSKATHLSQLSIGILADVEEEKKELALDVHRLPRVGIYLVCLTKGGVTVHNGSKSSFVMDVNSKKVPDPMLVDFNESVLKKSIKDFSQGENGCLGTKVIYVFWILM